MEKKNMHVLVTGGAGFIGSHIAEYHLERGDKVFVVDDLSTGSIKNIELLQKYPDFQFEQADILTWENLTEVSHWADRIYHMAAVVGMFRVLNEPLSVLSTNILGCERVLSAAATSKWHPDVLFASTSSVYGENTVVPVNENDSSMFPSLHGYQWNYGISKLVDELFCRTYASKKDLKVRIVRFFNMIGPRQTGMYGMVVPRFVKQAVQSQAITIYGDGTQTRSFCDVRDCVVMLDMLLQNEKTVGEVINVGCDHEISIRDLASLVKKIAETDVTLQYIPYEEAYNEIYYETLRRCPNLQKLRSHIDFQHKWCLEDTIKDLLQRERQSQ